MRTKLPKKLKILFVYSRGKDRFLGAGQKTAPAEMFSLLNIENTFSGRPLRNKFLRKEGCWYVMGDSNTVAGPYIDKAEAQIALAYFTAHHHWPSAKQLREFARCGK